MKTAIITLILAIISITACKEPYEPEVAATTNNLLVVEGYINTGGGLTTIKLSRTVDLKSQQIKVEPNATLKVEGENGLVVQGTSNNKGICTLETSNIDKTQKYRLRIITKNGKEYITDFLENKIAPPIGDIEYTTDSAGLSIELSTEDVNNNTNYYSWTFEELWEIASRHLSYYEYKNGNIVPRDESIPIRYCWQSAQSNEIIVGSSVMLSSDKINKAPITYIKGNSVKITRFYSINISQYGITKEAYEYLKILKKNTSELGGLFDPQPSSFKGNIRCVSNPSEEVIGYISSGSITQKRFYIDSKDLPLGEEGWKYIENCSSIIVQDVANYTNIGFLIIRYSPPEGWQMADARCVDCRTRGTNIKPAFWPR